MSEHPLLLPVVEGEGEVYAIPILLRRICSELLGLHHVVVRQPWRLARPKMVKQPELGRVMSVLAAASRGRHGGVLVLLDQDDDPCPVDLATTVARTVDTDVPVEVVVARREFEAWFLASASSLRGHRSVTDDAAYDTDPTRSSTTATSGSTPSTGSGSHLASARSSRTATSSTTAPGWRSQCRTSAGTDPAREFVEWHNDVVFLG